MSAIEASREIELSLRTDGPRYSTRAAINQHSLIDQVPSNDSPLNLRRSLIDAHNP